MFHGSLVQEIIIIRSSNLFLVLVARPAPVWVNGKSRSAVAAVNESRKRAGKIIGCACTDNAPRLPFCMHEPFPVIHVSAPL